MTVNNEGTFIRTWNVLAVDDEPYILTIIQEFLKNEECFIDTSEDAVQAWEKLSDPGSNYDFVILDRIMPRMDGLELLRRIKADSRLSALPVIMQSGANSAQQIAEGIEAGAFYYLTKPYDPRSLVCIARAVMAEIELRREVAVQTARFRESFKYFTAAELVFTSLDDVNRVAGILAAMCPDPDVASSGLVELLMNAVEHGNLGISYDEKKQLMYDGCWEKELERRLASPDYSHRQARVIFDRGATALTFRIIDQGDGFDWTHYLRLDPARSLDPNGRGIAMARRLSFSAIEYLGSGSEVVATIEL